VPGRILGIDVGSVRLGLALSDPLGVCASPLAVIERQPEEEALERIAAVAGERGVTAVVIGVPRRTDGRFGPEAEACRRFARAVGERLGLPVHEWDERFTTRQATRAMREAGVDERRGRGRVDKVAAALILQSFLDRRGRGGQGS